MDKRLILFEDESILVVNKPAGQYVHPSPGHETGTLTDELCKYCPAMFGVGSKERSGVVHRLDAETSGVMVFAKTKTAYLSLRAAFESHVKVRKTYLAVLHGVPKTKSGTLETNIGKKPWDPRRMAVDVPNGRRAVTHWTVLAKRNGVSLVEFVIETGRTHQIRVHAAHLDTPIVGDKLYGDSNKDRHLRIKPTRQLLHAVELKFPHPINGKQITFVAEPPPDLIYSV